MISVIAILIIAIGIASAIGCLALREWLGMAVSLIGVCIAIAWWMVQGS